MKCPLCSSEMTPSDGDIIVHADGTFPDFCQDYWCDKGHLIQAIACEKDTGFQVLIIDGPGGGDELFALWYTTKRRLTDITDWQTGRHVWSQ